MCDREKMNFDLYALYLDTAEKVSDRRWQANTWLLSVNSALVGLYGYIDKTSTAVNKTFEAWCWAIPLTGILVSLTWITLLISFRKLNTAKFELLHEIEKEFPILLFKREQEIYNKLGRTSFSKIETNIPWCFVILYFFMFILCFF